MSGKMASLEGILRDLQKNCEVHASAIVTDRGQVIWALLPQGVEEKAVSAMAAATVSIGRRVGNALASGFPDQILIDGTEKSVIIKDVGKVVLIGLADSNSEIGLIGFELDKAAERIEAILGAANGAG